MASVESEFIMHDSCPECGSSDALAVYNDHTFCFRCHNHVTTQSNTNYKSKRVSYVSLLGSAGRLHKRKISQKVCEQYKIYKHGDKLRFHYYDDKGQLVGVKTKTTGKDFRYEGESPGNFFGQHLFPDHGKRIVITEGELDAASCAEAMPGWQMVSLPAGAAAAKEVSAEELTVSTGL